MPKTVRCPNCGCSFEEELKDKGFTYSDVMAHIEGLLEGGQTIDTEVISKQYGRPRLEVSDMMAKIRKKNKDKVLRSVRQGSFKFLSDMEEISISSNKRWRNITGQLKVYAQVKSPSSAADSTRYWLLLSNPSRLLIKSLVATFLSSGCRVIYLVYSFLPVAQFSLRSPFHRYH